MSTNILEVSAAPFIALSAGYKHDPNVSLQPQFVQYVEGYDFFNHPIFDKSKDATFQKESFLSLTSPKLLSDLINAQYDVDPTKFSIFTALKSNSSLYIVNSSNSLYASAAEILPECLFRISYEDDKQSWTISQNSLYATIEADPITLKIKLEDKIEPDDDNLQHFIIEVNPLGDKLFIYSLAKFEDWKDLGELPATIVNGPIKRFWSYSEYPLESYQVKTIGMIPDDDYNNDNNYTWELGLGSLSALFLGYNGRVLWVKYYNDIYTKVFNDTVDIKKIFDVLDSRIIDWPYNADTTLSIYNSALKIGGFEINMGNLKNVHTPDYGYNSPVESS